MYDCLVSFWYNNSNCILLLIHFFVLITIIFKELTCLSLLLFLGSWHISNSVQGQQKTHIQGMCLDYWPWHRDIYTGKTWPECLCKKDKVRELLFENTMLESCFVRVTRFVLFCEGTCLFTEKRKKERKKKKRQLFFYVF